MTVRARQSRRGPGEILGREIRRVGSNLRRRISENLRTLGLHLRNRRRFRAVAAPYRLVWIQPQEVTRKINSGSVRVNALGAIVGGDWDRDTVSFRESPRHQSLVDRFTRGVPWRETVLFRDVYARRLGRGDCVLGMRSLEDLESYCADRIDTLYQDMRTEGFRAPSVWKRVDAVRIRIVREGEILWGFGGNHRLAIAKILRLPLILARVELRHLLWQLHRDRVHRLGTADGPLRIAHPDLADLARWRVPGAGPRALRRGAES